VSDVLFLILTSTRSIDLLQEVHSYYLPLSLVGLADSEISKQCLCQRPQQTNHYGGHGPAHQAGRPATGEIGCDTGLSAFLMWRKYVADNQGGRLCAR
jgi:hypothetical protein